MRGGLARGQVWRLLHRGIEDAILQREMRDQLSRERPPQRRHALRDAAIARCLRQLSGGQADLFMLRS
ncbi:hypothetical protein BF95_18580 [Sphingobium sp. Ant17]|nr:hypothetical protein BF95_18580 [Sphingobium sp. Ant17]